MIHAIVSDTHSPKCIETIYSHLKQIAKHHNDLDAVVINGDLLGIFSMEKSNIHRGDKISDQMITEYLKTAAPKFFSKFDGNVTPESALSYIAERYLWVIDILKKFSSVKRTIFNLGNHESKHHFLVISELIYLTKCDPSIEQKIDNKMLEKIFDSFEDKLKELENSHDFVYVRNNHFIDKDTMIIGIPGESHSTNSGDDFSKVQERKTKEILDGCKKELNKVSKLIIYNHTQGQYDNRNSKFVPYSLSLLEFMGSLPSHIKMKIFVQSHNHWSHTHFNQDEDFVYILNNAGLHGGIYNLLNFNTLDVNCFDVDPNRSDIVKLKLNDDFSDVGSEEELISRYYPDPNIVLARKNAFVFKDVEEENVFSNKVEESVQKETIEVYESTPALNNEMVNDLKKKIFG